MTGSRYTHGTRGAAHTPVLLRTCGNNCSELGRAAQGLNHRAQVDQRQRLRLHNGAKGTSYCNSSSSGSSSYHGLAGVVTVTYRLCPRHRSSRLRAPRCRLAHGLWSHLLAHLLGRRYLLGRRLVGRRLLGREGREGLVGRRRRDRLGRALVRLVKLHEHDHIGVAALADVPRLLGVDDVAHGSGDAQLGQRPEEHLRGRDAPLWALSCQRRRNRGAAERSTSASSSPKDEAIRGNQRQSEAIRGNQAHLRLLLAKG